MMRTSPATQLRHLRYHHHLYKHSSPPSHIIALHSFSLLSNPILREHSSVLKTQRQLDLSYFPTKMARHMVVLALLAVAVIGFASAHGDHAHAPASSPSAAHSPRSSKASPIHSPTRSPRSAPAPKLKKKAPAPAPEAGTAKVTPAPASEAGNAKITPAPVSQKHQSPPAPASEAGNAKITPAPVSQKHQSPPAPASEAGTAKVTPAATSRTPASVAAPADAPSAGASLKGSAATGAIALASLLFF
ncbi:hypothetical protein L1887_31952 [Cichorium endivia]|nr:hypothetical protein L1887_31952 [Cichorium endivia]